jgi:hypothetical protein
MPRVLIWSSNCLLLIIILIGIPAITGTQLGTLEISSVPELQMLTLCGLSVATAGNVVAAWLWARERKTRKLCWLWAVAFAGLFGVELAFIHGYLNFNWLRQTLVWFQKRF